MTDAQKIIKYIAIALASALIVAIFSSIAGVMRIFTLIDEGNATSDESTVYEISEAVTDLDFEIGAAAFSVKASDRLYIESNLKNLKVKENGTKLSVVEKTTFNYTAVNAFLTLYIPEGYSFNEVEIDAGAGRLSLGKFTCKTLTLELGAGDFDAEYLTVTDSCKIHGGVGEFTVHGGNITDLEIEMGIGDMKLISSLFGDSDLTFGVGNAEVVLGGNKEDYRLKVEKGIGSIDLDGNELNDDTAYGNGNNRIDIEGGIGNIEISFGEK